MTWLAGMPNIWQDFQRNPAAYTVHPWHVAWQNHLARQPIFAELTPRSHGKVVAAAQKKSYDDRRKDKGELKKRMPPRSAIQAIIDRSRTERDPWLNDEYD